MSNHNLILWIILLIKIFKTSVLPYIIRELFFYTKYDKLDRSFQNELEFLQTVLFSKYAQHLLGRKSRDKSVILEICTTLTRSKITRQECVEALINLMTWTLGEVIALANNILSQNKNKNFDAHYHYRKCTFIRVKHPHSFLYNVGFCVSKLCD
jgi:hypothetical protein